MWGRQGIWCGPWIQFNLVWVLVYGVTISDVLSHLNCVHSFNKSQGLNGWKSQQQFHQFGHHIDVLFSCFVSKLQFSFEVSSYIQELPAQTIQGYPGWL